jgi:hypothetical protein
VSDDTFSAGDDIEAGAYNATLVRIERKTSKADGSEFRIWRFQTPEGVDLSGSSSLATGPLSKTSRWAKAVLGRAPVPGESIGMLFGKPCIVAVETNEAGYAKVMDVYPAVAARKATPTATVPSDATPTPSVAPRASVTPVGDAADIEDDPIPF